MVEILQPLEVGDGDPAGVQIHVLTEGRGKLVTQFRVMQNFHPPYTIYLLVNELFTDRQDD